VARYSERYWQKPQLKHYLEFAAASLVRGALCWMPVGAASNILGAIGRTVGPRTGLSTRVRENIHHVWPDMPTADVEKIVRGVWDNFSRVSNDYWSLHKIRREQDKRIEIVGGEHLDALRESGKSGILFAGHIANWEMATLAARMHDLPLTEVYRPFNNPFIDALVRDWQRGSGVELIMKGREGARRITQVLKGDGHTIMLVDVRMNDGITAPFLGVDAMTPSAPAALALKYDAMLVPVRVERTGPANFRVTVEEPQPAINTGDRTADILAMTTWINDRISAWIVDKPEQWMWFHRRWGKNPTREAK
jgi:Kdo2-lipid IVA lauroyltransferase/acyltransferase